MKEKKEKTTLAEICGVKGKSKSNYTQLKKVRVLLSVIVFNFLFIRLSYAAPLLNSTFTVPQMHI